MHGKLMCMKIKYSVVFVWQRERFVDIKEMQLAFNWIRAFYDNILPTLHCKIAEFHVMLLIPILNLTPCSSEINPAKPWISKKAVEWPSQYFGVTRYAFISHL